jgi:predicted short-subunit dehydrogenase-like oxidoreductase (DUF2520 family)
VLIAAPDGAIASVAGALAELGLPAGTPVLHASGVLGVEALDAAAAAGLATGSIHPLVAVSDPVTGADRLCGAWYAVEGAPAARALAERWVAGLEGRTLSLREGAKPVYHAAAVFASNYVVALLSVATRLLEEAGVPSEQARAAATSLARGAVEGVERLGPEAALTGPVSRGDEATVAAHLGRLSAGDAALYSVLARETLVLARRRGLPADAAARLERLLEGEG